MGRYNHTTNEERTIDGQRTGTARPLPAMAPSKRPDSPPINPICGSGISPQARTAGHFNIPAACSVRARCNLPFARSTLPSRVGPFATYRRVSRLSASTICRCITACRVGNDRRARLTEPHCGADFMVPMRGVSSFASLKIKSKQRSDAFAAARVKGATVTDILTNDEIFPPQKFGRKNPAPSSEISLTSATTAWRRKAISSAHRNPRACRTSCTR